MTWVSYPLNTRELVIMAIKKIRHVASGFEHTDGYDTRKIASKGIEYLTKKRLEKLQKYFDYFDELQSKAHTIKRPRSKARLKALADYSGQKLLPGVKAVFVPGNPNENLKIIYNKKGTKVLRAAVNGLQRYSYDFDPVEFSIDWRRELTAAIDSMPLAKIFIIRNGSFTIGQGYDEVQIFDAIERLMSEYDIDSVDDISNEYGRWLIGIYGFNVGGIGGYRQIRSSLVMGDSKNKEVRKSARRKLKKLSEKATAEAKQGLALTMINKSRAEKGLSPIVPRPPEVTKKKKKSHPRGTK